MTASDPNFEPVARVTTVPWPGNAEGEAVYTRPTMAKFIVEDGDLPEMKEKASEALEAAGFPKTDRGKVEAILAFARNVMSYVPDSPMRQTCYRPRYMVCAQGAKLCVRIGNCVNMNCALGALLRAAGFDVKVQGIEYGGGAQDHVNILVRLPDEGGKWYEADATTNAAVGYVSPGKKHVYDPLNPAIAGAGAAGAFIGAGKAMQTVSMNDALFGRAVGAGVTTPTDVLSYRALWNDYVLQTVCALLVQNWACTQLAAGQGLTTIDLTSPLLKFPGSPNVCVDSWGQGIQGAQIFDTSIFAIQPPLPAQLTAYGQASQTRALAILTEWNIYAGWTDSQIVEQAGAILQSYQDTVRQVGTVERPSLVKASAGLAAAIAQGPSYDAQAQLIANIEGASILAHGVMKIAQIGADGAIEGFAALGQKTSWILSPWTWGIAASLLVGTVVVVAYNSDKVARLVSAGYGHAAEATKHPTRRKLRRSRRRRKMGRR